jgi:BON domain
MRTLLKGIGIGAGMAYLLDPDHGAGRRSVICDKAGMTLKQVAEGLSRGGRDLRNRLRGLAARMGDVFQSNEASDDVLEARVRSSLGRLVRSPRAVDVHVNDGIVLLRGFLLESELDRVVHGLSDVPGVKRVEPDVDLQIDAVRGPLAVARHRVPHRKLTPAARLAMGSAAMLLVGGGVCRGGTVGLAGGITGLGLFVRTLLP